MSSPLIESISIANLFGLYTYQLPENEKFNDAAILYGDNGVGKSTILRLVFHLLSSADNRGLRTALHSVPFTSLDVRLGSGVSLTAVRSAEAGAPLVLSVLKGPQLLAEWEYFPDRKRTEESEFNLDLTRALELARKSSSSALWDFFRTQGSSEKKDPNVYGEKAYMAALKAAAPAVFLLNADRRLDSDMVADPSDEVELRRLMRMGEPKRMHDVALRAREIALSQALATAARCVNGRVLQGANHGSTNVHSVYGQVVRHLLAAPNPTENAMASGALIALTKRLAAIEQKAAEYARYELTTPLPMAEFNQALNSPLTQATVSALIEPYVRSLESRLEALDPAYSALHKFVETVNTFLSDKSIAFRPSVGFLIVNRIGVHLEPAQLSSGEQQLLLLLCYVLTARDQPSVFIIDEPEISLNVKWQRQLVQSLLELTEGTDTQFLLASHSMELLAQHLGKVVRVGAGL
jgi:energy-coupling factor transporter ATP-binding protein EcfA2